MELPSFKKIIVLIAIAISFYIIYCLVARRQKLLATHSLEDIDALDQKEGFADTMVSIQSTSRLDLPLKEYFVYSSWNTCTDNNHNCTLAQLEKVAENGCRFMDFEVYNVDGNPEIGFSSEGYDPTVKAQVIESDTIPFDDFCRKILVMNAPNRRDPLFLHFRIKTNQASVLEKMANAVISSGMKSRLYTKDLTGETLLEDLQNRIIILVDKTYVGDLSKKMCKGACKTDFSKMIGVYSASSVFPSMKIQHKIQDQPKMLTSDSADEDRTNVEKWQMVSHDFGSLYENKNRLDFKELIMKHQIQIIPHKFYYRDDGLADYKEFFADNGRKAFITMGVVHHALARP